MAAQEFDFRFADCHCHILPGVDDGSPDLETSLKMAHLAQENNTDTIIVTPHYTAAHRTASPDGIRRRVHELQSACDAEGLLIRFYPGNELFYDSTLPDVLQRGGALTLAESSCCLVEFHPTDSFQYIYDGLRALCYAGFTPILAHCERYLTLVKNPELSGDLVDLGVKLQCNAASVETKLFNPVPKYVNWLLKREMVSLIATDAHRASGERAPNLMKAASFIKRRYDPAYVEALLHGNASKLLNDGKL